MTFDPRVQVILDTDRANSRTFKRRDFVRPPRENYEDNAGQERNQASFSQPTIADEHFVDEIKVETPEESVGGGGTGADGFQFHYADGIITDVFPWATVLAGYNPANHDDWSIKLTVSSGAFTGALTYVSTAGALTGDLDSAQSYYLLPVIRDGKKVSTGGSYRENLLCIGSAGPRVELVKIA